MDKCILVVSEIATPADFNDPRSCCFTAGILLKSRSVTKTPQTKTESGSVKKTHQLEKLNYRVGLVRLADTTAEFGVLTIHS